MYEVRGARNKLVSFNNLLICSFFVLGFIGIVNHELWQDEMQAWMIATDTSSIADLLKNLKYEGHTALWYLCLRILNWFNDNPFTMQVFHLIIATINICIFAIFAPFNKLQKLLFAFGYFPFYEYNILSRNYNLGILLIFSFCALFFIRRNSYFPLAFILALLAHTNIFGLILTIVLQLTLLLETFIESEPISFKRWDFIASFFIVILSIVGAIIQLKPPATGVQGNLIPSDTTVWQTIFAQISDLDRLMELISNVWKAYFPIYHFSPWLESITLFLLAVTFFSLVLKIFIKRPPIRFSYLAITFLLICIFVFNRSHKFFSLEISNYAALLGALVSLAILVWFSSWFVRQPLILFLYLSGSLGIFLFTYLIYYSDNLRHTGHFFFLFIICYWLEENRNNSTLFTIEPSVAIERYKKQAIALLFLIHSFAGIFAYSNDLIRPFSMSKATSNYIENTQLNNLPLMGVPDERVSAIPGYLNRKIYYPQSDRWGTFVIWDSQRENVTAKEIVEPSKERQLIKRNIAGEMNKIVQENPTDVLFVSTAPINFQIPGLKITPIKQFIADTIGRENSYRLYLIQKKALPNKK